MYHDPDLQVTEAHLDEYWQRFEHIFRDHPKLDRQEAVDKLNSVDTFI